MNADYIKQAIKEQQEHTEAMLAEVRYAKENNTKQENTWAALAMDSIKRTAELEKKLEMAA